eukprot:477645_1
MSGSSQSFYLVSRKHSSVSRKSFKEFKQPTTTTKMPTKKIVDENLDLNGSTSKKRKKRSKKRKKRSKNKSKNKQKTPQSTDLPILMLFPAMFCLVICNNEHYRRMYQHSQVEALA